jgi:16S rRNA (guanine527-N7)-methyltransferase
VTGSQDQESPAAFTRHIAVSRETLERLQVYADLLRKWQATINLVGPATLPALWTRHFLDSAQVLRHVPDGPILDMGSGAGFPGLVLSILRGDVGVAHLVESDTRKCAFLREVIRATGATAVVHNVRLEALDPFPVATITARALAPLEKLLEWAAPFLAGGAECLFLKGRTGEDELTQAAKNWKMKVVKVASLSDPTAIIFHLREVYRG